ncbi:NUDIX domain-containing protein [Nocardioides donggukensis]|uniref:NUDIX hydrolase n=1 Tax=Nocardioides donggukensis TaxID=2774019 RepID=A0A927Q1A4_9ACTN|nr:NUDIX hydrolase [Nocardioides donggukensis]MBD8869279.1 NUDIX hydrolase [Nocardioides donggukensis]
MSTDPLLADREESWPVSSSTVLHRDDWIVGLRSDQVAHPGDPDGPAFGRLVLEHPGAALVLALDDDDRVFCLSQYRHPAQRRFVELPAGVIDAEGEDPLDVARRELREEAELQASEWTHLLSVWASPGISAERQHVYLARGLSHADRGDFELHHEEADMETFWVPFADLRAAVLDGRCADAPVALAVLAHDARRRDAEGSGAPR